VKRFISGNWRRSLQITRKLANFQPLFRLVAKAQHYSKTIETAVRSAVALVETDRNSPNAQQNTRQRNALPGA
jgi:hypothetical protein